MKKFFNEFKDFALKGNVMDLAVAVIIGAAFQSIITSLTKDIISPILGLFGGMNFDAYYLDLFGAQLMYGSFITAVINFIIMALVIFLLIKGINQLTRFRKTKDAIIEKETTKICSYCFTEIPIEATRCPHCTSVLHQESPKA